MLTQSSKWAPPQVFVWHTTLLGNVEKLLYAHRKLNITATDYLT